uniref:AB hydrolase-1 domain-containing protein n=1 Tax=Hyaloperonospora arabidopsidis (strain Emoy2) TaxID=559515 RepID=M4BHM5_HYAAE
MPSTSTLPPPPWPPALFRSTWFRLFLLLLTPLFVLFLTLWGLLGRLLTLSPQSVVAASFVITWLLYFFLPHLPVYLIDCPLVITLGIVTLSQLPRHHSHVAHAVVIVSLIVYAIIRISLTRLESGSTEKSIIDALAALCCLVPIWVSICNLHLWLPSDLKELEKLEKKIYEQFVVTDFKMTKIAGLGTIHVPYCGDDQQLLPRNLVLVHGYMASNSFWAAAMYSTYFAEKYSEHVEHLILVSPAGVNPSDLTQDGLPFFLKLTSRFYVTPMSAVRFAGPLGPSLVRWSWRQRMKWVPETNIIRSGELDFGLITDYCYHNWALEASGDIAFYTHLHPGASARRRALNQILTREKLQVPLTIMYGGGKDWMNSEHGAAVVRRLEKTQYAVFRLVPISGHQVFMDNPGDFNQILVEEARNQEHAAAPYNKLD